MPRWPNSDLRGGRVVVLMLNHALVYPLFQGIFRAGGTAIPVMPQSAVAELRDVLADTEAQLVVTDVERLATVREAVAGLPHVRHILVQGGADSFETWPAEIGLESLLDAEPRTALPRGQRRRGRDVVFVRHDRPPQGRAAVARELVVQRRGGLRGLRARLVARAPHHAQRHADRAYLWCGYHERSVDDARASGRQDPPRPDALVRSRTIHGPDSGASLHVDRGRADDPGLAAASPTAGQFDLSSLVEVLCGGAPLPAELAQAFMRRHPARIREVYGLTEATGLGTANRRTEVYRPGSAGACTAIRN